MRALTVLPGKANSAAVETVPEPRASDGSVVVKTLAVGVCGTDLEIVSGAYGWAPPGRERLVIGHESLGRVVEAPAGSGLKAGDLVAGIVRRPDPVPCANCAVGEWDMCRNGRYTERGIKERDGFCSEFFGIEPDFTVKLDPALGANGVLIEPTSVVAKAWDHVERIGRRAQWAPRRALVTGAGPIGLLAALLGRQRGLEVHVLDVVSSGPKPRLVKALGAEYHSNGVKGLAFAPDVVIECTGAAGVLFDVLGAAAPDGIVCLAGISSGGHQLTLDLGLVDRDLVLRNNVVFGSVNANRAHYQAAAEALARADQRWLEALVTRRVGLDQWSDALVRKPDDVKVVIELSQAMSRGIEDYALIGDCETAALVGCDGSIDWLCLPHFDGGACFASLLGTSEHGRWLIAPCADARVTRRYRGDTLVLETLFEAPGGAVALIDFMPPLGAGSDLVRIVEGRSGQVEMRCELVWRFDYGSIVPWVRRLDDGAISAIAGPDLAVLRTPVELHGEDMRTVGTFTVGAGERVPFVMSYGPSHLPVPGALDAGRALDETERFWQTWADRCQPAGRWTGLVRRSLITLKALTYAPTGAIVAAPTTSLPEWIGGARNWDYRFCWLRDATFTLLALMNGGFHEEAAAWRDWLLRAAAGSAQQTQILYGIGGERRIPELELPWLPGYENSRPVRVGNAASTQLQLDVFGEVMDALHVARCSDEIPGDEAAWELQREMLDHLETIWREPDEGIWEVRNGRRQFTYSKVMAWVAFDRAVKSAEQAHLDGPIDRWRKLRDVIHEEVCRNGFNPHVGSFTQFYGSDHLDASLLLIPLVGFLPPSDPRIQGTVAAIEQRLMSGGFVLRYDSEANPDGLPAGEGVFLACSFWLADNYVLLGRQADAERLFDRLAGLVNDVGLLSEEYDPGAQRLIGNFPQAFSHISLVNTAHNLSRAEKPAERRAGVPPGLKASA